MTTQAIERTYEWTANLLNRGRLRRALRFAGVRFTEHRGLLFSTFTINGNPVQLWLALGVYQNGGAR